MLGSLSSHMNRVFSNILIVDYTEDGIVNPVGNVTNFLIVCLHHETTLWVLNTNMGDLVTVMNTKVTKDMVTVTDTNLLEE